MRLLQFLFTAIIILWLIRLLVRLILPAVVRNAFGNMQNQTQQQRNSKPEGTISIDYMPKKTQKKGSVDNLGGEFVDYEEVK